MSGSVGVAVRKAVTIGADGEGGLKAHLGGLAAFNGVTDSAAAVEVAYAFTAAQAQQQLYTGRSRGETPAAQIKGGRNARNETCFFDLNILVQPAGADVITADERCQDIGVVVEEWLGDRKSGGDLKDAVPELQTINVVSWAADYRQFDFGWASIRTYAVRWTARLT